MENRDPSFFKGRVFGNSDFENGGSELKVLDPMISDMVHFRKIFYPFVTLVQFFQANSASEYVL